MLVRYRTKKLQKVCENRSSAVREYGPEMAYKLQMRVSQLKSSESVKMLIQHRIGRCHELTGDRSGQYAMDLAQPYRLIFTQREDAVITVWIEEITDYHKGR